MDQHTHQQPDEAKPARPVQANRIITRLNSRLDEKANQLRQAEDREVYLQALTEELEDALTTRVHIIDQIVAENRILRARLGIAEGEPIELTDDEAAEASQAGAEVDEETPHG